MVEFEDPPRQSLELVDCFDRLLARRAGRERPRVEVLGRVEGSVCSLGGTDDEYKVQRPDDTLKRSLMAVVSWQFPLMVEVVLVGVVDRRLARSGEAHIGIPSTFEPGLIDLGVALLE